MIQLVVEKLSFIMSVNSGNTAALECKNVSNIIKSSLLLEWQIEMLLLFEYTNHCSPYASLMQNWGLDWV
mgnify:CR=1 FL=1